MQQIDRHKSHRSRVLGSCEIPFGQSRWRAWWVEKERCDTSNNRRKRPKGKRKGEWRKKTEKKKSQGTELCSRTEIKKTYRHIIGLCGSGSYQIETDIGYSASMVASLASPSRVLGSDYQIRWEPKVKHPSVVIDLRSTPITPWGSFRDSTKLRPASRFSFWQNRHSGWYLEYTRKSLFASVHPQVSFCAM